AGTVDGLVEVVTQCWRLWHQAAGLTQGLRGAIQIALLQCLPALLHVGLGELALVLLQACVAAGALLQRVELVARVVETLFGQAQVELTEGKDQIIDRRQAVLLRVLAAGQQQNQKKRKTTKSERLHDNASRIVQKTRNHTASYR